MLSNAHLSWDGGPPKNFKRENLKIGLKFSVCTSMTSGLMGISSQFFIQTTCRELMVIMWVQLLDGLPRKIWDGENRSKSCAISDNFRIWSRISLELIQKSKIEKVVHQLQPLLRCTKKGGEPRSTNKKVIDVHIDPPKWTLFGSKTIFGPYGVMCPQIFIRATNCRRLANAHPNWDEVTPPPKKIIMKI